MSTSPTTMSGSVKRALSVFEFLTDDEIRAGLQQLERDAQRADPGEPVGEMVDLLVLRRA